MAFLPLDKKFNPDFAIPGKKPVGGVEVDWSSPLANKLEFLFMDLLSPDLVTGLVPDSISATQKISFMERWGAGRSTSFNGSTNGVIWPSSPGHKTLTSSTLNALCKVSSFPVSYAGITSISAGGETSAVNYVDFLGITSDKRIRAFWEYGSGTNVLTDSVVTSMNTDEWHIITIVRETAGTSSVAFYLDGVAVSGGTTGLTNPSGGSSSTVHVGRDNTGFYFDGEVAFSTRSSRAWSAEEVARFAKDPYQILKPTTQTGYFPSGVAAVTSALTGTATATITETDITDGGKTIIVTLTGDTFKAAGTGPIGSTADTQAFIDGFDAAASPTNGWNNEVRDKALTSEVVRTSSTIATWTISAQAGYDISATETITGTIPTDVLVTGAGAITSTPTFTIDPVSGFQVAWARNSNTVIQVGM